MIAVLQLFVDIQVLRRAGGQNSLLQVLVAAVVAWALHGCGGSKPSSGSSPSGSSPSGSGSSSSGSSSIDPAHAAVVESAFAAVDDLKTQLWNIKFNKTWGPGAGMGSLGSDLGIWDDLGIGGNFDDAYLNIEKMHSSLQHRSWMSKPVERQEKLPQLEESFNKMDTHIKNAQANCEKAKKVKFEGKVKFVCESLSVIKKAVDTVEEKVKEVMQVGKQLAEAEALLEMHGMRNVDRTQSTDCKSDAFRLHTDEVKQPLVGRQGALLLGGP